MVTGVMRGAAPAAPAADLASLFADDAEEPASPEPARARVRQADGEEIGIDIPAFLRRQTSS